MSTLAQRGSDSFLSKCSCCKNSCKPRIMLCSLAAVIATNRTCPGQRARAPLGAEWNGFRKTSNAIPVEVSRSILGARKELVINRSKSSDLVEIGWAGNGEARISPMLPPPSR